MFSQNSKLSVCFVFLTNHINNKDLWCKRDGQPNRKRVCKPISRRCHVTEHDAHDAAPGFFQHLQSDHGKVFQEVHFQSANESARGQGAGMRAQMPREIDRLQHEVSEGGQRGERQTARDQNERIDGTRTTTTRNRRATEHNSSHSRNERRIKAKLTNTIHILYHFACICAPPPKSIFFFFEKFTF